MCDSLINAGAMPHGLGCFAVQVALAVPVRGALVLRGSTLIRPQVPFACRQRAFVLLPKPPTVL